MRYGELGNFDRDMNYWEKIFGVMMHGHEYVTLKNEKDKMIVFERGELIYIFNFHTHNSYEDFLIGTLWPSDHMILYNTDESRFGGHNRLEAGMTKWYPVE